MNKKLFTAMLVLGGATLFGQEVSDLNGTKKNDKGEYVNKYPNNMIGYLQFSQSLKPGYYSLTCNVADKFPTLFWATGKGAVGGYTNCRTADTPRLFMYYFKVTDGSKLAFKISANIPKGNKSPVDFAAKDFKLTALEKNPANMFPDFQIALKDTPEKKNFIYCFDDRKSTAVTKTMIDGIPVMSIEGNSEKQ